jgi:hypothetical protein
MKEAYVASDNYKNVFMFHNPEITPQSMNHNSIQDRHELVMFLDMLHSLYQTGERLA